MYSIAIKYFVAVVVASATIVYFESRDIDYGVAVIQEPASKPQPSPATPPSIQIQDSNQIETLIAEISLSDELLEEEIANLLRQSEFKLARARLMQLAADAVEDDNKSRLGHVMTLLGQVAIEEQDLDNAEVYLLEALDVYKNIGDDVGTAHVYVQLGKSHLKSRQLARVAGYAYDRLLIARWQLSQKRYGEAEDNLQRTIEDNIAINRFGAAASAYSTLVNLYTEQNFTHQAETAAAESATLYAASGQMDKAKSILRELEQAGIEPNLLLSVEESINNGYAEFNASIMQIERAKDYKRLYNHYSSKGDTERAWKLRVQANRSLANVSKRAMYHRQPDVLAVLHNSNTDMEQAGTYLSQAQVLFTKQGLAEDSMYSQGLTEQIY